MDTAEITAYIVNTITHKFTRDADARKEGLHAVLSLSGLCSDKNVEEVAKDIPPLPDSLYRQWATMFAESLIRTVGEREINDLCQPDEKSAATLMLVFIMFMESERMEKQIAADLRADSL